MDTHDVREISSTSSLQEGFVVTIEPGLYIPFDEDIPERFLNSFFYHLTLHRYRGIGVRIEDDVLVTSTVPEVLTKYIPKEADEIENLMRSTSL